SELRAAASNLRIAAVSSGLAAGGSGVTFGGAAAFGAGVDLFAAADFPESGLDGFDPPASAILSGIASDAPGGSGSLVNSFSVGLPDFAFGPALLREAAWSVGSPGAMAGVLSTAVGKLTGEASACRAVTGGAAL